MVSDPAKEIEVSSKSITFTKDEQQEARQALRDMLFVGQTVYVIQRHVSSSGMTRHLSLFIVTNNKPLDITRLAAKAMGDRLYTDNGWYLKVGGAGMDMHFHTVYSLSRALFPEGHPCTGQRGCPSNDHSNDYGVFSREFDQANLEYDKQDDAYVARRQEYIAHEIEQSYRTTRMHSDGGYALNKETF